MDKVLDESPRHADYAKLERDVTWPIERKKRERERERERERGAWMGGAPENGDRIHDERQFRFWPSFGD